MGRSAEWHGSPAEGGLELAMLMLKEEGSQSNFYIEVILRLSCDFFIGYFVNLYDDISTIWVMLLTAYEGEKGCHW